MITDLQRPNSFASGGKRSEFRTVEMEVDVCVKSSKLRTNVIKDVTSYYLRFHIGPYPVVIAHVKYKLAS